MDRPPDKVIKTAGKQPQTAEYRRFREDGFLLQ